MSEELPTFATVPKDILPEQCSKCFSICDLQDIGEEGNTLWAHVCPLCNTIVAVELTEKQLEELKE